MAPADLLEWERESKEIPNAAELKLANLLQNRSLVRRQERQHKVRLRGVQRLSIRTEDLARVGRAPDVGVIAVSSGLTHARGKNQPRTCCVGRCLRVAAGRPPMS